MEFYWRSALGTCNSKDSYRELLVENSDRFHAVPYIFWSAENSLATRIPLRRKSTTAIWYSAAERRVYRDSVQTDDLHRAIQYLDEDACGSPRAFVFHPRRTRYHQVPGGNARGTKPTPNKNCIVPCRVALFTRRRISKTVGRVSRVNDRRLEIRGYAGITLKELSLSIPCSSGNSQRLLSAATHPRESRLPMTRHSCQY